MSADINDQNVCLCTKACDIRCECHRLLARLDGDTLELSCPRCKRKIEIDLKEIARNQSIPESLHFK